MIAAYSPQARGRSERNFGTWQGRLPQELRLAGIDTVEGANCFLRQRYIQEFNERFSVAAAEKGTAFRRTSRSDLNWIFSVQTERVVAKDNTVAIKERIWQIDKTRFRNSLAGSTVTIHGRARTNHCGAARSVDAISRLLGDAEGKKRIALGQVLFGNRVRSPRLIEVAHVEFDEAVRSDGMRHADASLRPRRALRLRRSLAESFGTLGIKCRGPWRGRFPPASAGPSRLLGSDPARSSHPAD